MRPDYIGPWPRPRRADWSPVRARPEENVSQPGAFAPGSNLPPFQSGPLRGSRCSCSGWCQRFAAGSDAFTEIRATIVVVERREPSTAADWAQKFPRRLLLPESRLAEIRDAPPHRQKPARIVVAAIRRCTRRRRNRRRLFARTKRRAEKDEADFLRAHHLAGIGETVLLAKSSARIGASLVFDRFMPSPKSARAVCAVNVARRRFRRSFLARLERPGDRRGLFAARNESVEVGGPIRGAFLPSPISALCFSSCKVPRGFRQSSFRRENGHRRHGLGAHDD